MGSGAAVHWTLDQGGGGEGDSHMKGAEMLIDTFRSINLLRILVSLWVFRTERQF